MLSSISWQEFITTIVILVAGYYLVTVLIFYRKEITHLLKNGGSSLKANMTTQEEEQRSASSSQSKSSSMMGLAGKQEDRSVPHTSHERSDDLTYAPSDELPEPVTETGNENEYSEEIPVGIISDLLEEIKAICGAITDSVATREEATSLFHALLSRYQNLKDTPYQASINDHIESMTREPFIVEFSREEIESFWDGEL